MRKIAGVLGLLVVGCAGAGTEEAKQTEAAATEQKGASTDQKFRADIALLETALQVCSAPEALQDPDCGRNVALQLRGGNAIKTQGIIDLQTIYQGILKKIGSYAKGSVCRYLEGWKGFNNVYYARGVNVTAGAFQTITAGVELVYDIGDRQMAVFYYTGGGWGNVLGASVGAYAGFGFSKSKQGLFDAWSGSSWSHNVNASPPGEVVGVGVSKISNADGSVIAGTGSISVGVNLRSFLGVADYSYTESYYTPFDVATDHLRPSGATLQTGGGHYWQFEDHELGAGWYLAFEMIRLELMLAEATRYSTLAISGPTWTAALMSIGSEYVRHEDVEHTIEHYCADTVAEVKCGGDNSLVPCQSTLFERPDMPSPDLNVGE